MFSIQILSSVLALCISYVFIMTFLKKEPKLTYFKPGSIILALAIVTSSNIFSTQLLGGNTFNISSSISFIFLIIAEIMSFVLVFLIFKKRKPEATSNIFLYLVIFMAVALLIHILTQLTFIAYS